ncbi:MAG: hypothetical protein H0U67_05310 [Gemmatimonadetes bacterium]|nr:hypothetical protein [Gemmatimonadota bacterium]
MLRNSRIASTAALILLLGACSTKGSQNQPAVSERQTRVEVTNHNWSDMRVYVVRAGNRFRLGTVSTMGTQVFQLPRALSSYTGGLQLVADPIGSREFYMTQPLSVIPGQLVSFKIENHLAISTVSVW